MTTVNDIIAHNAKINYVLDCNNPYEQEKLNDFRRHQLPLSYKLTLAEVAELSGDIASGHNYNCNEIMLVLPVFRQEFIRDYKIAVNKFGTYNTDKAILHKITCEMFGYIPETALKLNSYNVAYEQGYVRSLLSIYSDQVIRLKVGIYMTELKSTGAIDSYDWVCDKTTRPLQSTVRYSKDDVTGMCCVMDILDDIHTSSMLNAMAE